MAAARPDDRLILHPSVLIRWWCPFLDYYDEARRVRWKLEGGLINGYVPYDMAVRVLGECEKVLRGNPQPTAEREAVRDAVNIIGIARRNITLAINGFVYRQVIHIERDRPLERMNVWGIHQQLGVRLPDAPFVWLAIRGGITFAYCR